MALTDTLMARRKQDASAAIAHAALELIARDGFGETSVDAIAAAAGCSSRTFYRYFRSKEDALFYDLPAVMEQLGGVLDEHLVAGLSAWAAVSESIVDFISRFDDDDQWFARRRVQIWLDEPALRSRYMEYVAQTEEAIAECLHRHAGTTPSDDDRPQLIAAVATGAYRATLFAPNTPSAAGATLTERLRSALTTLGRGLGDAPPRRARPGRD